MAEADQAHAIGEALGLLGKRRLALAIHDASFPSAATRRGTPYSEDGLALVRLARGLGFDALQLGPQGLTSPGNPSPYDAALSSRDPLSLDWAALREDPRWAGLIHDDDLRRLESAAPGPLDRVDQEGAFAATRAVEDAVWARLGQARARGAPAARALVAEAEAFVDEHAWVARDALFDVLAARHGSHAWRRWPPQDRALWLSGPAATARRAALIASHEEAVLRHATWQVALRAQHRAWRRRLRGLGVRVFADLQVGMSLRDAWGLAPLLLEGYRLGAPPSRTNPAGQPWDYPLLDPALLEGPGGEPGPALRAFQARVAAVLAFYDGVRLDHPHGLVCPWVYRTPPPDSALAEAQAAVQRGARLFSSPDLDDHPELARFAIARPEQLDRAVARHADGWVRELDEAQVGRYARLVDALMDEVRARRLDPQDVPCEVLSTQPYPLGRVLARHGLGRFRVTPKADVRDPEDVYLSEQARPEDWVMLGTHDTPPIWQLAREWRDTQKGATRADYLARRLRPRGGAEALARELRADPRKLVHAQAADLFVSEARHVLVFFADLLGLEEIYNRPGVIDPANWTLRVPRDFAARYAAAAAEGRALDLPCALALALRARGLERAAPELLARLEARAWWVPAAA